MNTERDDRAETTTEKQRPATFSYLDHFNNLLSGVTTKHEDLKGKHFLFTENIIFFYNINIFTRKLNINIIVYFLIR